MWCAGRGPKGWRGFAIMLTTSCRRGSCPGSPLHARFTPVCTELDIRRRKWEELITIRQRDLCLGCLGFHLDVAMMRRTLRAGLVRLALQSRLPASVQPTTRLLGTVSLLDSSRSVVCGLRCQPFSSDCGPQTLTQEQQAASDEMDKRIVDAATQDGTQGVANLVDKEGEKFTVDNVTKAFDLLADTVNSAESLDEQELLQHPGVQVLIGAGGFGLGVEGGPSSPGPF